MESNLGRRKRLLNSLHSAGSKQRNPEEQLCEGTTASSAKGDGGALGMPGLLGTQLRIVLHFIFKEMPWEGSGVFKTKTKMETAGLSQAAGKEELACFPG